MIQWVKCPNSPDLNNTGINSPFNCFLIALRFSKFSMLDKKVVLTRVKTKRNMFDKKGVLTREKVKKTCSTRNFLIVIKITVF